MVLTLESNLALEIEEDDEDVEDKTENQEDLIRSCKSILQEVKTKLGILA